MTDKLFIYIICGVFFSPMIGLLIYIVCISLYFLYSLLREYIEFNVEQHKYRKALEIPEYHYSVTIEYGTKLFVFYTDAYYYAVRYGGTLREIESDLILYDGGRGE